MQKLVANSVNLRRQIWCDTTGTHCYLAMKPELELSSTDLLWDECPRILVRNLQPWQQIKLELVMKDESHRCWRSWGTFTACPPGVVDVEVSCSEQGTYTGVDVAGLWWSMIPDAGWVSAYRFRTGDVTNHVPVALSLYSHGGTLLAEKTLRRWFLAERVKRTSIRESGLVGTLFVPESCAVERFPDDKAKYVGVVDMYGSTGGLVEHRAALLASHGFVTLALAYVAFEDLPRSLDQISLSYLEKAVTWLAAHCKVDSSKGIGVIGSSKGGELALALASVCSVVGAVVSLVGSDIITTWPLHHKGEEALPSVPIELARMKTVEMAHRTAALSKDTPFTESDVYSTLNIWEPAFKSSPDVIEAATIKVEHINGSILLIRFSLRSSCVCPWIGNTLH